MVDPTQAKLYEIVEAIRKTQKVWNKADAYRHVMKELNAIAGATWTYGYVANLHRGVQIETASDKIILAIKVLHKRLCKAPKPKPLDTEIAKRTLVLHATVPELHEIQKKYEPRERAVRLLESEK